MFVWGPRALNDHFVLLNWLSARAAASYAIVTLPLGVLKASPGDTAILTENDSNSSKITV
jgi:hypothetical protein